MLEIVSKFPQDNSDNIFTNEEFVIEFTEEINDSYLNLNYFKLYKSNENYTSFSDLCNINITKDNKKIRILPSPSLDINTYYILLIIGNANGIEDINNNILSQNEFIRFKTGISAKTYIEVVDIPENVTSVIPGGTENTYPPSTDLFTNSGINVPITCINTIPSNYSLGVQNIDKIIFIFNDDIANIVIPSAISGRYAQLPFDTNPFIDHSIEIKEVYANKNVLTVTTEPITIAINREYIFTLNSGYVKGVNRQGFNDKYVLRFTSILDPVYATAEQIITRLKGFNENTNINISEYDIYKLILEKSLEFKSKINSNLDTITTNVLNSVIVCMVLRDIILSGFITHGAIKSRELLANKVEYYQFKPEDALKSLDECINDGLELLHETKIITTGIKSGNTLIRPTKIYQVNR